MAFRTVSARETHAVWAVYAVSLDDLFALKLDSLRLHRLRPVYGYRNLPDATKDVFCPEGPCIFKIDLATVRWLQCFAMAILSASNTSLKWTLRSTRPTT